MFPNLIKKQNKNNGYCIGLYGRDDFGRFGVMRFYSIPERSSQTIGGLEKEIAVLLAEKQRQEKEQEKAKKLFNLPEDGINYTRFFLGSFSTEVVLVYKQHRVELIEEDENRRIRIKSGIET